MRLYAPIPLALALSFAFFSQGCGARPWNTTHALLEAAAEGVADTDEILATAMEPALADARHEALADATITDQEAIELYESLVERWEAAATALEVTREALIAAEASVTIWRATQEEPADFSDIWRASLNAIGALVRAIEACGVEVPAGLRGMLP